MVSDSRTRAQIGVGAISSPLGASGFFAPLRCDAFRPNSGANGNVAEFCKPAIDALIKRALAEQAFDVHAANQLWAKVDRELIDQAPLVPLYTLTLAELVSKRVGNFEFSPQWSTLADQLWVR